MKSEIVEVERKTGYPKLMKSESSETVVLFTSEGTGVVVHTGNHRLGYFSSDWKELNFRPFNGKIQLSND